MIGMKRGLYIFIALIIFFLLCNCGLEAKSSVMSTPTGNPSYKKITGKVIDSETGEPLPFATIKSMSNLKDSRVADENGNFVIPIGYKGKSWTVSMTGYEPYLFEYEGNDSVLIISLSPSQMLLEEVVINPGKEKYSKKNNPAVEFVKRLKMASRRHNPVSEPYYSYDLYEKTVIGLNDFNSDFSKGIMSKSGKFLENYVDVSPVTGRKVLDLMLKEKSSSRLYSKTEGTSAVEVLRGYRSFGVDEVINQDNMRIILEDAVREIDPFNNDIILLQNRFVSPLSSIGPDFYKYFLTDTVDLAGERCIELSFVPHNPQSMGFNGKIYVPENDSMMFVRKITMRTPGDINMNLVDNIFISLSYDKDGLGNRHKTYDDVCIEFSLIPQAPKLYGRKTTLYKNFSYKKRDDLKDFYKKMGSYFVLEKSDSRDGSFWEANRLMPLSSVEEKMGGFMQEARHNKVLFWGEKLLRLLESGYVITGKPSKFDFGPINTLISANTVEGVRFRLGGMTVAALNPHLFTAAYIAYGTKDKKFKYDVKMEYSFEKKKMHSFEWPRHGFFARYGYDVDMIGQHYLFTNSDNVFLSFKRKESILATYRRIIELGYIIELKNNFSFEARIRKETQEATKWIEFKFPDGRVIGKYGQNAMALSLRWAPGEKFIQGRTTRSPVNMDAWVFQLTHEFGPKGLGGSSFSLNRTELKIQKRLWFSAFGYTDIIAKGGIIWSSVFFPALLWPNTNLSYTIQPESFSLLNPMEFANDKYGSLDLSYYGMGVLFNRVPLIKKLKLREIITFKGLVGGLSPRNNPSLMKDLPIFPDDANVGLMRSTPYMEAGVGIDNILMFLRVDYIWRLTYRDKPGCDNSGLRISAHFSF